MLVIVETQLNIVLGYLLSLTLLEQGGLDSMVSAGPFWPHIFCDVK